MNILRHHVRAIRKIRSARDTIIRVAAAMQAKGVDTSALTPPLVEIQEALAELEVVGEPAETSHRRNRPARKKAGG